MAKENKSRYAVLGFLSDAPMSGYEIKKICDATIGYFWNENYGNIYPVLKKLNEEKMVTMTKHTQDGSPDKKEYHITQKGLNEMEKWLHREPSNRHLREELLLQLKFAHHIPIDIMLEKLEIRKNNCMKVLVDLKMLFEQCEQNIKDECAELDGPDFSQWYYEINRKHIIAFGCDFYQMEIDWCKNAIKDLTELQEHIRDAQRNSS